MRLVSRFTPPKYQQTAWNSRNTPHFIFLEKFTENFAITSHLRLKIPQKQGFLSGDGKKRHVPADR
jgi:hypothetical protein